MDRIRVVSDVDQNLRLDPITGVVAFVDGSLAYAAGDVNAGIDPNAVHSASINNFAGATTTRLYNVDTGLDVLTFQDPPNAGGSIITALSVVIPAPGAAADE